MRMPSGTVDQYIYFIGVDATDFATRETGLSTFTVYRSRNGGAPAAMTTPTINETDGTNMPGVYELLLDEDMTIDAGDDSQEMVFHITHAGMAPVTRTIELYRPKITVGETSTAQTGDSFARLGAPAGASVSADVAAVKVDTAAILVDTGTTLDAKIDTIDGIVDAILLDTAEIGAAGAGLTALATAANLATVAGYLDTEIAAILADTNELQTDWANGGRLDLILDARASQASVDTIDGIVDSILVDTAEIGAAGAGLTALATASSLSAVGGDVTSILADTNELQTDWTNGGRLDLLIDAIKVVTDALPNSGALTDLATAAALATVDGNVDSILVDTGTTLPAAIAALNDLAASDILTTQLTESYAADGVEPTLAQAIFLIQQFLYERATSGTTVTVKKLDGATTAATLTLNDGTSPTSITRAS